MTARIRLTLPSPPSANRYWTVAPGRGLVVTSEAQAYKREVAAVVAALGVLPLVGDVIWGPGIWYRPRRAGDAGANRLKVLEDALNGLAYLDDDQIAMYELWRRSDDDPRHPRVELLLQGEAFASPAQAAAHRQRVAELAAKRRETRNRNRKLRQLEQLGVHVTPASKRVR
jgi:crossover junction endodeoxyribonuclease RusA